ncbi:MAG: site-specific integrase [Propionibacteriaceae bacterium]|nr:site-specific integrase [Propionibacteriaceae bacterium]
MPTIKRANGAGSVYRTAAGQWVAAVTLPPAGDGRQRRATAKRRTKAQAMAALRTLIDGPAKTGKPRAAPTVAQWIDTHLGRQADRLKPHTHEGQRSLARAWIVPVLGRVRLDQLTGDHVRALHRAAIDAGHATTAKRAHALLSAALQAAVRDGLLDRNMAQTVGPPAGRSETRPALTADQAKRLLASVAGDPARSATIATALLTGLRQGERLGLESDALDLDRGVLTVSWAAQEVAWAHGCDGDGCGQSRGASCPQRVTPVPASLEARHVDGALWLLRPKSRAGWRQVPVCGPLADRLAAWLAVRPGAPHGLVFTDPAGRPVTRRADSAAWRTDLQAAGLPPVPLHSARHTTATLLFELGVPPETRQAILGHSAATTTAGYTHVAPPMAADAMSQLGGLLLG